ERTGNVEVVRCVAASVRAIWSQPMNQVQHESTFTATEGAWVGCSEQFGGDLYLRLSRSEPSRRNQLRPGFQPGMDENVVLVVGTPTEQVDAREEGGNVDKTLAAAHRAHE